MLKNPPEISRNLGKSLGSCLWYSLDSFGGFVVATHVKNHFHIGNDESIN
jgi:hypothetical protein